MGSSSLDMNELNFYNKKSGQVYDIFNKQDKITSNHP